MKKPSRPRLQLQGVNSMHIGLLALLGLFFLGQVGKLALGLYLGTEELGILSAAALLVIMSLMGLGSLALALLLWKHQSTTCGEDKPEEPSE